MGISLNNGQQQAKCHKVKVNMVNNLSEQSNITPETEGRDMIIYQIPARETVVKIKGERKTFFATFERYGSKTEWYHSPFSQGQLVEKSVMTILLVDVVEADGKPITGHIWLNLTNGFRALNLKGGEKIAFAARATPDWKGNVPEVGEHGQPKDWKLTNPTKIRLVSKP